MATWKKVVVSGSAVSQLDNDANYVSATGLGILSSSAQIASNISGAFTATSGGFSTRITTNATNITTNTTNIGTLTNATSSYALKTQVSGAFTSVSSSIAVDIAALEAAVGAGGTLISSSVEGDNQGQIKLNGVNVNVHELGDTDSPTFANLTLTGDLFVNGNLTNVNTTNLNVEDKFILLASGSSTAAGDAGIIIEQSAVGVGSAFGWDQSEGRFGFDAAGADATSNTVTFDAYAAAVVTTGSAAYAKAGNISIDGGDIFIYV